MLFWGQFIASASGEKCTQRNQVNDAITGVLVGNFLCRFEVPMESSS